MAEERAQRRLAAILAADVVGYSRLMGVSETGTLAALKTHRRELVDARIAEHQGRIVKVTGDGLLVEFPSVVNAVACAVEIQRKMIERNADVPEDQRIEFRIGVNLGDIIFEDNDIFGDGVNVAARIESIAEPGGVCISSSVRDSVGNRLDLAFEDMGEQTLKNIERPGARLQYLARRAAGGSVPAPQHAGTAGEGQTFNRRPALQQHEWRSRAGIFHRRHHRGHHHRSVEDLGSSRHRSKHGVHLQGQASEGPAGRRRAQVKFVLEGSVRKAGQRVRVTGQLIDARMAVMSGPTGTTATLPISSLIQDEITHTIVDQLKVKLLPEEQKAIAQAPTGNVEAYTYYLRGRELFHSRNKSSLTRARSLFARAAELDPLYARAYAGMADCDSTLYGYFGAKVSLESILEICDKALTLDPGLAETHASRGLALAAGGRHQEAVAEFERAIASIQIPMRATTSMPATRSSRVILKGLSSIMRGPPKSSPTTTGLP